MEVSFNHRVAAMPNPTLDEFTRDAALYEVRHSPVTVSVKTALRNAELPKERMEMTTQHRRMPHRMFPFVQENQTRFAITDMFLDEVQHPTLDRNHAVGVLTLWRLQLAIEDAAPHVNLVADPINVGDFQAVQFTRAAARFAD